MKYFYCLSLFLLIQLNVFAQNNRYDSDIFSNFNIFEDANFIEFNEDSILIRIPSVNELIHNAKNSAQVKYYETQKDVDERDLRTIKRSWKIGRAHV